MRWPESSPSTELPSRRSPPWAPGGARSLTRPVSRCHGHCRILGRMTDGADSHYALGPWEGVSLDRVITRIEVEFLAETKTVCRPPAYNNPRERNRGE